MTLGETREILGVIKAEWPQSFNGMSRRDGEAKLSLWAAMFADDDVRLVGAAVKAIIVAGNREFAPGVGQIKEQMRKLVSHDEMSEAEAWGHIVEAVRNSAYGASEEFEKLPPILQKLVVSPTQLKDWAMMDSGVLQSVVASNVQRAYRTIREREAEQAKLPKSVKTLIASITGQFALEKLEK